MAADIRSTGRLARLLWYGSLSVGAVLGLVVGVVAADTYIAHSKPHSPKGSPR